MQAEEATQLFAQAHHDFRGGKYDLACVALSRIQAAMGQHSGVLHLMALAEKGRGNLGAARAAFETAMQIAPDDGEIAANAANLFASMGDLDRALEAYAKAIAALPQRKDIVLNRSINLVSAGRGREAIGYLHEIGPHFSADARYWTVLGQAHQSIREIDEAVQCYERALAFEPMRAVALAALGALKLEQGDPTAVSTLRKAQRASDGRNDGDNVLLLSEALESEGRTSEAISLMSEAVSSRPDWIAGLKSLARMQGEAGLPDAISVVFESAISAKPVVPVIWANYASLLRADDAPQAAIDVLERAKRAVGADGQLLLIEAGIAVDIGDTNRSREILDSLPPETPGLEPLRVRQAIRCGEPELGGRLAAGLLESAPDDIGLWALASLCWRMTNDPKEAWLNPGNGLYLATEIDLPAPIDQICGVLRGLHHANRHPVGQSLRNGTQTRGSLFARKHPLLPAVADAIRVGVERYRAGLPAADPSHPFLKHRNTALQFTGSWSVRLTNGGFHVSHIHPLGVLSSAFYAAVPQQARSGDEMGGWLEIGSAPPELATELQPLAIIEPKPGRLVLFPSYLFHGTRPFESGERLTIAFDMAPA